MLKNVRSKYSRLNADLLGVCMYTWILFSLRDTSNNRTYNHIPMDNVKSIGPKRINASLTSLK